jgi:hypothetical protein
MNRNLPILALALVSSSAFATYCPDNSGVGDHVNDDCHAPFKNPTKNPSTGGGGGGGAGVGVGVAAAQSSAGASAVGTGGKSISNAAGGNATANGGRQQQQQAQQQRQSLNNTNSNQSGGGSVVIEGNQSGSGDRSSFVAWAPVIHGPAAPALASANLVVVPGVCGPRVRVITSQIVGQHYGPAGGRYEENRGYMETLGPWLDEDGNPGKPFVWRDGFMLGHVVTQYAAVVGTSSAASFSLGGFVDSKGLQGGAAGSGAAQQLVKSIQVADCLYAMPKPEVVQPTVIYQTRTRTVTKWRDRPVAPPCCVVPPPCCTVQPSPPISLAK